MEEKQLWIEVDYFDGFRCKGGSCRNSCCGGWNIAVGMDEYFRIIGMDCSPELHSRLECAFKIPENPSPERYRIITPNWLGRCPLQDEDGLCALQRHCGEAALPEICRVYPRSLKREGGRLQACCSCSCEAVTEQLMQEEKLSFRLVERASKAEISEDVGENSARMLHACLTILQNREFAARERIAEICAMLNCEKTVLSGPEALNTALYCISEMSSESPILFEIAKPVRARYSGDGAWEAFCADCASFERNYPRWMTVFENVLANHLVYQDFPFADSRIRPADACCGLSLLYSAMHIITAAGLNDCSGDDAFADVLAAIFHPAEHSPFYFNARVLTGGKMVLV